ncbi:MAG: hypothetical protein PWR29_832 [Methanolobus sp.]|jgi:hypothetical protein|nr:hypothetical protein [Methanolobus sp.]MDK2911875.1 hypothetical protein [Methanolobus sp.]MDN5310568.1 hypothetical protein [Methanolobus sp.]
MIIPKNYLISLFNEIKSHTGSVEVVYPPIGTLFKVDFGDTCTLYTMPIKIYQEKRESLFRWKHGSVLDKEVPTHNDLQVCYYAASLWRSDNEPELIEIIREGCNRDLLKGQKPLFIGYDTNSMRHQTTRVVEDIVSHISRKGNTSMGYCLSENVKAELRYQWDAKYRFEEIKELATHLPFANKFLNQPPKDARMARLGAVEYKRIMSLPNCQETDGKGRTGDEKIINSYESFRDKRNVDILLISGDNNFVAMAHEERMQAIYMKQPVRHHDVLELRWEDVTEMIYIVAIVFGYIQINGISVFGSWKGKLEEDWDRCRLYIDALDDNQKKFLFKDLEILIKGQS